MFEFFIVTALAIAFGLVIFSVIFTVGTFALITNTKFAKWMMNLIIDRCSKLNEAWSQTDEKE